MFRALAHLTKHIFQTLIISGLGSIPQEPTKGREHLRSLLAHTSQEPSVLTSPVQVSIVHRP